jgi:hypothetical protein
MFKYLKKLKAEKADALAEGSLPISTFVAERPMNSSHSDNNKTTG